MTIDSFKNAGHAVDLMKQVTATGATFVVTHFVRKTTEGWRVVCKPDMQELHGTKYHPPQHRTNEIRMVTCQDCLKIIGDRK